PQYRLASGRAAGARRGLRYGPAGGPRRSRWRSFGHAMTVARQPGSRVGPQADPPPHTPGRRVAAAVRPGPGSQSPTLARRDPRPARAAWRRSRTITEGTDMIEVCKLTKRSGAAVAVDDLSFTVHPGRVTGFLGPNGAGKSTTMRVILGLDAPTAGHATING